MIALTEIEQYFEKQIHELCDAGQGWEHWYPKYSTCKQVTQINDLFCWIERGERGLFIPQQKEALEPFEQLAQDYDYNLLDALFEAFNTVKAIHDTYYTPHSTKRG